jgi:hypothetical protein
MYNITDGSLQKVAAHSDIVKLIYHIVLDPQTSVDGVAQRSKKE